MELVRAQVANVDLFIAVSDYYARFMRDYLRDSANRRCGSPRSA